MAAENKNSQVEPIESLDWLKPNTSEREKQKRAIMSVHKEMAEDEKDKK